MSTAAHSRLLLRAFQIHVLPSKQEEADVRTDEDADNDVPIEVHSQLKDLISIVSADTAYSCTYQHDKICHRKLQHMQQCSNYLLEHAWPESGAAELCASEKVSYACY
jgi:hypothetical protein